MGAFQGSYEFVKNHHVAIAASSSGNNTILAAISNRRLVLTSYVIVANAAVTAKWRSDDTDLSGAMSLAANGGVSAPEVTSGHVATALGEALKVNLGGAVGINGHCTIAEYKPIE